MQNELYASHSQLSCLLMDTMSPWFYYKRVDKSWIIKMHRPQLCSYSCSSNVMLMFPTALVTQRTISLEQLCISYMFVSFHFVICSQL